MRPIDRLYEFIESINYTAYAFENETSISNGYLAKQKERRGQIGSEILDKIHSSFPQLNLVWLITGNGEMLIKSGLSKLDSLIAKADKNIPKIVLDIAKENAEKENSIPADKMGYNLGSNLGSKPKNSLIYDGRQNIILVEQRVAAGWAQLVQEEAQIESLPRFTVPHLMHKMGTYYCFPVAGDSMHPTVKDKEWVIVEQKESVTDIKGGRVYMFCTAEGLCLKRLYYKTGEKSIKCESDNETYASYKEPVENILSIYEAIMHFSDDFRNWNHDVRLSLNAALERITVIEKHIFKNK